MKPSHQYYDAKVKVEPGTTGEAVEEIAPLPAPSIPNVHVEVKVEKADDTVCMDEDEELVDVGTHQDYYNGSKVEAVDVDSEEELSDLLIKECYSIQPQLEDLSEDEPPVLEKETGPDDDDYDEPMDRVEIPQMPILTPEVLPTQNPAVDCVDESASDVEDYDDSEDGADHDNLTSESDEDSDTILNVSTNHQFMRFFKTVTSRVFWCKYCDGYFEGIETLKTHYEEYHHVASWRINEGNFATWDLEVCNTHCYYKKN